MSKTESKMTMVFEDDNGKTMEFKTLVPIMDFQMDFENNFHRAASDGYLIKTESRGAWVNFKMYLPHMPGIDRLFTYEVKEKDQMTTSPSTYVDRVPSYPVKRLSQDNVAEIAHFIGSNSWTVCQGSLDQDFGVAFHAISNGQDDVVVMEDDYVVLKDVHTEKYKIKVYNYDKFHRKFEKKILR